MRKRYKRIRAKKKGVGEEDGRDHLPPEIYPADELSSDDQLTRYLEIFVVLAFKTSVLDCMMRCHLIW
jgi:hypothetical protein